MRNDVLDQKHPKRSEKPFLDQKAPNYENRPKIG